MKHALVIAGILAGVVGSAAAIVAFSMRGDRGSSAMEARFHAHRPAPRADDGPPLRNHPDGYGIEAIDLELKTPMARLEEAFEARSPAKVGELLHDEFRGSALGPLVALPAGGHPAAGQHPTAGGLVAGAARLDEGPSERWCEDKTSFLAALEEYFGNFDYVYEAFFKVKHYAEKRTFRNRAEIRIKLDLRGRRTDGATHQEFVYWKASVLRTEDGWRLDRWFVEERHQSAAPAAAFSEVTAASGLTIAETPARAITGLGKISPIDRRSSTNFDYGGVALVDVDEDGDLDIFLPNAYDRFALFVNGGDGTFRDEAEERGIVEGGGARGAAFADVDNDGDLDLFVCRGPFHQQKVTTGSNLFYENLGGGRFREATARAGLTLVGASMSATFLDYDRDGFLDLFVGNYGDGKNAEGESHPFLATNGLRNELYRNRGDGSFENVTDRAGVGRETYWTYAVAVVDWNQDRYPDIYVANDFGPNNFYVNHGDGTFKDEAARYGVEDIGNGMGASFVDHDRDGDWDLYVTNMQSSTGRRVLTAAESVLTDREDFRWLWKLTLGNTFFRNDGNRKFDEVAGDLGIADCGWAWHGDFADFDADGDQDLLVMNGYYSGAGKTDC